MSTLTLDARDAGTIDFEQLDELTFTGDMSVESTAPNMCMAANTLSPDMCITSCVSGFTILCDSTTYLA